MANPILLPENFANYDFVSMARKTPHPKDRIRLIAMANIQEGKTFVQISSILKVHWKTIQSWLAKFRKNGIKSLYVKTKKYKPRKLDPAIEEWIANFLDRLNSEATGGHIPASNSMC